MKDFFVRYFPEIITAVIGFSAWAFERKKRKQEIKRADIENQQQIVDLYQEVLNDLKKRYDHKFEDLKEEINELRNNLNLWKRKYQTLKKEFEFYKKNDDTEKIKTI